MPNIHFEPDKSTVFVPAKSTILRAAFEGGIPHQHACGGKAKCTTCRVKVIKGLEHCEPRNQKETHMAGKIGLRDDIRLACQTRITGDVVVRRLVIDEIDLDIAQTRVEHNVVEQIGEEIEATVVFMDMENFTSFTDRNQPYDVVHILNRYYYMAGRSVRKHNGVILDYYGDGILAIFGHKKHTDHAVSAFQASKEIKNGMIQLSNYVNMFTPHPFNIRIGIHTGKVILGTMGMPGFEKLAAVGDTVNVASRIENANKELGTTMLISEHVKSCLHDHVTVRNEYFIAVKGKNKDLKVYEIV